MITCLVTGLRLVRNAGDCAQLMEQRREQNCVSRTLFQYMTERPHSSHCYICTRINYRLPIHNSFANLHAAQLNIMKHFMSTVFCAVPVLEYWAFPTDSFSLHSYWIARLQELFCTKYEHCNLHCITNVFVLNYCNRPSYVKLEMSHIH
jgi:hypothetical protein